MTFAEVRTSASNALGQNEKLHKIIIRFFFFLASQRFNQIPTQILLGILELSTKSKFSRNF